LKPRGREKEKEVSYVGNVSEEERKQHFVVSMTG